MPPFHCLPDGLGFCRPATGESSSTTSFAPTAVAMEWTVACWDSMLGVASPVPFEPGLLPER